MRQSAFSPWIDRDPFADMRRLQGAMNRLFDGGRTFDRSTNNPPVNFWAGEDSVVMTAELPGLTEQDIELTIKDTMVSIHCTYPDLDPGEDAVWHRRERPTGSSLRSVELPFRINPDNIEARFENGVLMVEMQRPEEDKPKRIQIKTS